MSKGTSLILIILSAAIFYTFTSPQYAKVQALSAQAAEYQDVLDNVSRIAAARDSLLSNYESISATDKDRLSKALPDSVDIVGLAKELDSVASKYGITLTRVQTDEDAGRNFPGGAGDDDAPYGKAFVSFSFVSSHESFVKFLADLEKSLRIMDIRSASFQTAESGIYEHKITVETYWLK